MKTQLIYEILYIFLLLTLKYRFMIHDSVFYSLFYCFDQKYQCQKTCRKRKSTYNATINQLENRSLVTTYTLFAFWFFIFQRRCGYLLSLNFMQFDIRQCQNCLNPVFYRILCARRKKNNFSMATTSIKGNQVFTCFQQLNIRKPVTQ